MTKLQESIERALPPGATPHAVPPGGAVARGPLYDTVPLSQLPPSQGLPVREEARPSYPTSLEEKWEALRSGFALQNSIASAIVGPARPGDFADEGFVPDFLQLERDGYDSSKFLNVRSEEHEAWLRSKVDAERERRRIASESGYGFVGEVFGALTDPWVIAATAVSWGAGLGLRGIVAAETLGAAGAEATLQATQTERTMSETALNIAASGIAAGVVGGLAQGLGKEWMRAKTRALARDMGRSVSGEPLDPNIADALADELLEHYDAVGAMPARFSDPAAEDLVGGRLIEKMTIGPMGRLLASTSASARSLATQLADSSFIQQKHLGKHTDGEVVGNPVSAEGVHRDDMARVDRAIDKQNELYRAYLKRQGVTIVQRMPGGRRTWLNREQFSSEVAQAMRNGDIHDIPEVAQAAQFYREHAMREVFERALRTGELVDDHTRAMDAMYGTYSRRYDADVQRFGNTVDQISEAFFKAFQKGVDEAERAAQEADLDTFRVWRQTVAESEAAGGPMPAPGAGTAESVERGARTSPWMDKKARATLRRSVEQYLEEHGFDAMATPAGVRGLLKHLDELYEGRFVIPDRGPDFGHGNSQLARDIATTARIALRGMDETMFATEVDVAFRRLQDEHLNLLALADEPFDPRGNPGRGRLSRDEFEDAMRSTWNGTYADTDALQVDRLKGAMHAWRRKQAKRNGLDPNDVALPAPGLIYHSTASSYFPRIIDDVAIVRDGEGLRVAIEQHLIREGVEADAAADAAEQVLNGYRMHNRSELPQGFRVVGEAGVSKARVVNIPDNVLAPWMVNDPARAIRGWSRSLGMRAHYVEAFGDRELTEVLGEVHDEYIEQLRRLDQAMPVRDDFGSDEAFAQASKQWEDGAGRRETLSAQWRQDQDDLEALRDRLVGQYGRAESYDKALEGIFDRVRLFNMLTMLGGAALSSVTDIARPIQAYGLRPFAKGMASFIRQFPRRHKDLKNLGVGLVYAHNSRFAMLSDVDLTTLSGVQRTAGTWFLNAAGITTWDTFIQRVGGYTALAGLEEMTQGWSKVSAKQKARLARAGIGDQEAQLIGEAFAKFGPDVNTWPMDQSVKRIVRMAVQSDVDHMAFKPTVGDQPLLMSSATGKTLLQFKQFVINAHNRMLVAGLQQNDINFYMAFLVSGTVGAMVAEAKSRLRGKGSIVEQEGGVTQAAIESFGRAGWYGLYEPFKDLGMHAAGWTPSRFAAQNLMGAVGGPTWNQAQRASGAIASAVSPDSELTYAQLAPLAPFANVMHLRDMAERLVNLGKEG